jgi:uncharacterized protein YggL (DUF469 family)
MPKQRTRRLRKKLRLGEFQQFGFDVSFRLRDEIREDELVRFWDAFLLDAIERNGLAFGGGTDGFVCPSGHGPLNESHRELVRNWLTARPEVVSAQVGPLVDAWHQSDQTGL